LRLGRAFNSQDPTLEVNLLAYGFGVAMTAVWLSVALWKTGGLDGNWVAALGLFLGAVTGGLFKKGAHANQEAKDSGAPDKDGEP
jgi:hypothetical protein